MPKLVPEYFMTEPPGAGRPIEAEPPLRKMLEEWGFDFWSEVNSKHGATTTYTSPDGGCISIHYGKSHLNVVGVDLLLPYAYAGQKRESFSLNDGNGIEPIESRINGLLAFNRYLQKRG